MALITESLKNIIERIIRQIELQYRNNQGLILSEDDLKCLIYKKLNQLFLYRGRLFHSNRFQSLNLRGIQPEVQLEGLPKWRAQTIDDGFYASPVHAEIPWFDENNRLTIRPDITILEPRQLSILHGLSGPKLPSKQFEFGGQGIIFEIKFNRFKSGISPHFLRGIQHDFNKIEGLFARLRQEGVGQGLFCYFVIFNKTDVKCLEFEHFLNQHCTGWNYKFLYGTGLVDYRR